jgi:hypothetical protein
VGRGGAGLLYKKMMRNKSDYQVAPISTEQSSFDLVGSPVQLDLHTITGSQHGVDAISTIVFLFIDTLLVASLVEF